MRDKAYLRDVRKRKIQRKNVLVKQFMAWIGIHMMDSIQSEKIHCGCGSCKFGKKYGLPTIRDMREKSREHILYEDYKNNPDRLDGMLLYDDGIIKGIINGHSIGDKTIEITDFYVEPFFVGQGIGTLLMKHMIQQIKEKGYRKIILWVIKDNAGARKFYEMNGFANSGETRIIQGTAKEDCCYEYVFE